MRRHTELIWGLIGIALAAWWIARSLGTLPPGLDDFILRAAPALLILIGLTYLLRRWIPLSGGVALALTGLIVAGVGYAAYSSRASQMRSENQQAVSQVVNPQLSLLRVRVGALATDVELIAGTTTDSVSGQFVGSSDNTVEVDYQELGDGTATLTLFETRRTGDFPMLETVGRGTLELNLPVDVPVDIEFVSDQGSVALNLAGLSLERLNATATNGDLVVTLPDYNPTYSQPEEVLGTLEASNGALVLVIPASVAARLELNRLGSGIEPEFDPDQYDELVGEVLQDKDIRVANNVIAYALVARRIRVETSG